jgi:hypothetical protein
LPFTLFWYSTNFLLDSLFTLAPQQTTFYTFFNVMCNDTAIAATWKEAWGQSRLQKRSERKLFSSVLLFEWLHIIMLIFGWFFLRSRSSEWPIKEKS